MCVCVPTCGQGVNALYLLIKARWTKLIALIDSCHIQREICIIAKGLIMGLKLGICSSIARESQKNVKKAGPFGIRSSLTGGTHVSVHSLVAT